MPLSCAFSFVTGMSSVGLIERIQTQNEVEKIDITQQVDSLPFWESQSEALESPFFEIVNIEAEESPRITEATPDRILSDYQNRVGDDFEIPDLIFNQTKFWFRIYTEFDSTKKVIHDSLHPHIIYDVVDISDVLALPARAQWLNVVKAEKLVAKRVAEIRSKLKKMINKDRAKMTDEELGWLAQFDEIKGNRKKIISTASQNIRVQTGQKDFFEKGLNMSSRYLEGMETIFREKKLPLELTRLPFVESSFVIGATSKVGAAGIWQFMPGVGRKFMTINDQIDERRNPWKATEAAARLLKENYIILHKKWGLALTAYNHGPGGVRRAMQTVGSKDIAKIVKSYRSKNFDFASANFYTCFLAALHAHMYRDIIWPDHVYEPTLEFETHKLTRTQKPRDLLLKTGLTEEQLLLYNPELDRSVARNDSIPKGYRLYLPTQAKLAMEDSLSRPRSSMAP